MDKYGVETCDCGDAHPCENEKTGGCTCCRHPTESVVVENGVRFCKKCEKYLVNGTDVRNH